MKGYSFKILIYMRNTMSNENIEVKAWAVVLKKMCSLSMSTEIVFEVKISKYRALSNN